MDVAALVVDEAVSVDVVVGTAAAGVEDEVALATEAAEEEAVVALVIEAAGVVDEVLPEVVVEVAVALAVVVVPVDVVAGEDEAALGEELEPFLSPIPTPESSLPKAKTTCWSPKISFLANPSTARNGYRLKPPNPRVTRPSTVSGTLSGLNWLLVSSVEWVTSLSSLVRRCFTSVLPVEPPSAMLLTLLARKALSTPWNSLLVLAVT